MSKPHPRICLASVAIGIAAVSIALGLIYRDAALRERAIAQIAYERQTTLDSIDEDEVWDAWEPGYWLGALASGTLGVSLLGIGIAVVLYDLPGLIRAARQSPPPTYDRP